MIKSRRKIPDELDDNQSDYPPSMEHSNGPPPTGKIPLKRKLFKFAIRCATTVIHYISMMLQFLFPTQLKVENVTIRSANQNTAQLKVIHISDIHYDKPSNYVSLSLLDKMVDVCNEEKPDLILLTGDYVQYSSEPITELCTRWLSKLKAKYGVFAVLGNHDYKDSKNNGHLQISRSLEDVGIKVLSSESVRIPVSLSNDEDIYTNTTKFMPEKREVVLIGLSDIDHLDDNKVHKAFSVLNEKNSQTTDDVPSITIVLSHRPTSAFDFLKFDYAYDLQLSGHIHGTCHYYYT
eukprot:TRINITY_DN6756_c0_g1_i2.p1 TRINITY_DN6756_c0_g1~~TRINITY_DN6756_c0_g1_i2.p1  ORF type:complete len:292 (-),score=55.69 TRINITY_DN6756_c0_g1_i2:298-1173(-)